MFSLPQQWLGSGAPVFPRVGAHTNATRGIRRAPRPDPRRELPGPSAALRPGPQPARPRTAAAATLPQQRARRLRAHLDALVAGAGGHAAAVEVEGHIVDEVAVIRGDAARHEHPAAANTRAQAPPRVRAPSRRRERRGGSGGGGTGSGGIEGHGGGRDRASLSGKLPPPPRPTATRREDITSGCTRGRVGWTLGGISSQER